jgi:AbrB family looped-hinge helix DNA binding protein
MKVGERGQVTIPKEIRDRFGIKPNAEVRFDVVDGRIVLMKASGKSTIAKWRGRCSGSLSQLGYGSIDKYIDDVRGR